MFNQFRHRFFKKIGDGTIKRKFISAATADSFGFGPKKIASAMALLFSGIALLTLNERREIRQEKLRIKAKNMTLPITDENNLDELDGKLIHYVGTLNTPEPPQDHEFNLTSPKIVTLRRRVEMFQWKEVEHIDYINIIKDGVKSTETKKTYTYDRDWSSSFQEILHEPNKRNPPFPPSLQGERVFYADLYKIGQKIMLSPQLTNQLDEFRPLRLTLQMFKTDINTLPYQMTVQGDCLTNSKKKWTGPEVGELRVYYDAILSDTYTTVSVLKASEGRYTAVPLMGKFKESLASMGPVTMPKDSEKILGFKLDTFIIPESVIEQMENLLTTIAPFKIAYLGSGSRSVNAAYQNIDKMDSDKTTSLRFLGGIIVWAGVWSLAGPFAYTSAGVFGSLISAFALSYHTIEEARPKPIVGAHTIDIDDK